jgi:hypothetical protein
LNHHNLNKEEKKNDYSNKIEVL